MFTGLIEEIGTIQRLIKAGNGLVITIDCPVIRDKINTGDSIAVDGVCLTATELTNTGFRADVSPETVERSIIENYKRGTRVNVELAMSAGSRFGGHIVQGHVDAVGKMLASTTSGNGWEFTFAYPIGIAKQIVEKGSISINGISLTIAKLYTGNFTVAVVPHTYKSTNLNFLQNGDEVNLETDILAKYVERMLGVPGTENTVTDEYLKSHGYGFSEE